MLHRQAEPEVRARASAGFSESIAIAVPRSALLEPADRVLERIVRNEVAAGERHAADLLGQALSQAESVLDNEGAHPRSAPLGQVLGIDPDAVGDEGMEVDATVRVMMPTRGGRVG